MTITALYSDPHFGHRAVIEYCDRPFADLDEMHAVLIERYNEAIAPTGVVLWCGDAFFMGWREARELLDRMHGRKLLVRGNHDGTLAKCARIGFDVVGDEMHLRIGERHCLVSHYPYGGAVHRDGTMDGRYLDRRPMRVKGRVLIHGHTHSPEQREGTAIHVGVDAWDYRPAMMPDVEALVADIGRRPT